MTHVSEILPWHYQFTFMIFEVRSLQTLIVMNIQLTFL